MIGVLPDIEEDAQTPLRIASITFNIESTNAARRHPLALAKHLMVLSTCMCTIALTTLN
jgi:hypothetical protein